MSGDALAASVVIPARDAEATVGAAVRALLADRGHGGDAGRALEVVVVDDGSRDATAAVAAQAGARVVRAAGDGPARARNLGVAATSAPIVVFTDADCTPRPGFVAALLAPFRDPSVAGAKGAYETEQRSLVARFVQQEYAERYRRMARRATIDFVDTYAAAYRREAFVAAGGFDERYRLPSTEDQELSFRLASRGARLVFVPDARVAHLHAATLGAYLRKKVKIGTFKVATLRAHPGKAVDDAHTPASLKLQVALAPLALAGVAGAAVVLGGGAQLTGGAAPGTVAALLLLPAAAFLASTLPLATRALLADPPVGPLVPALCLLRALALGLGVARGVVAELRGGVLRAPS